MTKIFYLLYLISVSAIVQANVITVKGYVKNANGSAVANKEVKIQVYLSASTSACSELVVVTDASGHYSKELSCTGEIHRSRISLKNCDGSVVVLEKEIPLSKTVEANFTSCQAAAPTCGPKFTAEPVHPSSTVPPFSVKFNSSTSEVATGDKIVERTWNLHDGTAILSNRVDPLHSFPHAGTYEVCLNIKPALGCENKICKQILVPTLAPVACAAQYRFERLAPKKFRFNSSSSVIDPDDKIIERKWDFKDGATSTDVSPAHEFHHTGNYEVCLTIKTAKGCESKFCSLVKVEESPAVNHAQIEIVSLYPSPVHETLKAVLFSKHNNIVATVSIIDDHGIVQYSKQFTLLNGYNPIAIQLNLLKPGAYVFKLTTAQGSISKKIYKI